MSFPTVFVFFLSCAVQCSLPASSTTTSNTRRRLASRKPPLSLYNLKSRELAARLKSSVSVVEAAEDGDVHELFDHYNCEHVYIDMGTNVGVQIRKIHEPQKYPNALALPVFQKYFGPGPRCNVCTIGFEPNPSHSRRLDILQRRYRASGAGVLIFNAAVGTQTGILEYGTHSKKADENDDWAGSVVSATNTYTGQQLFRSVRSVDVARIIKLADARLRQKFGGKRLNSKIVAKSDVESSEFTVFPHLVMTKAICALDFVFIEWHTGHFDPVVHGRKQTQYFEPNRRGVVEAHDFVLNVVHQLNKMFAQGRNETETCATEFSEIDDETYRRDGLPWPTQPFCKTVS
mmetsp:Transcript_43258/g.72115  ORF Transcript_43258/g.72115 Transcript_43258/m.72115 type:complete len:346 (+) Transcript_43258:117-1154(+)